MHYSWPKLLHNVGEMLHSETSIFTEIYSFCTYPILGHFNTALNEAINSELRVLHAAQVSALELVWFRPAPLSPSEANT